MELLFYLNVACNGMSVPASWTSVAALTSSIMPPPGTL